jgi:hypothetical protein
MWQQPLAAQAAEAEADKREARVYEQYLTRVLKELRRSEKGEMENELDMYSRGERPLTAPRIRS